jgi:hypothetical protein
MSTTRPVVKINILPRRQFRPYLERKERFAVMVCHRRAGKTIACIQDLLHRAGTNTRLDPPPRYAYLAPTYDQVRQIAWEYLKKYTRQIPGVVIKEADLLVILPSGASIKLMSAENYERIRGTYLDGCVIDEAADCPPVAWHSVIRPCLSDYQGWASFVGTSKGRNALWRMWNDALQDPDWFTLMLKADESGILLDAELDAIRRGTPTHIFAQEFLCDFSVARPGAIFASLIETARNEKRVSNDVLWYKESPVYTSWDVGAPLNQRVWIWQIIGDKIVMLESLFGDLDCGTPGDWSKRLLDRKYNYGAHFIPHDASTSMGGLWQNLLSQAGLANIVPVPRQHSVWDGINLAREAFPRVYFNLDGCALGLESLDNYSAKELNDGVTIMDIPIHDFNSHASDAFSQAFQAIHAGLVVNRNHLPRRVRMAMGQKAAIMGYRGDI